MGLPRNIGLGIPEARGIRGEHLIAEGNGPRVRIQAEFDLGVGQDNAAFASNRFGPGINTQSQITQLAGHLGPDPFDDLLERDVLVMFAHLRLRRGGENRRLQRRTIDQTFG